MGAFTLFFFLFFWKRPCWLAPSPKKKLKKSEHWTLPNRSTSLNQPNCKNKNKCVSYGPPFSVYIHESWTLGKPCGIKGRWCYWELLGEPFGNFMGAHREHDWNKGRSKKAKINFPKTRNPSRVHAESSIYKVHMLIIASLNCKQARPSIVDPTNLV
jgi:hypothetical protein